MHKDWCGKDCSECKTSCKLDESMACSPDCELLGTDGEPENINECIACGCECLDYDSMTGVVDPAVLQKNIFRYLELFRYADGSEIACTIRNLIKTYYHSDEDPNPRDFTLGRVLGYIEGRGIESTESCNYKLFIHKIRVYTEESFNKWLEEENSAYKRYGQIVKEVLSRYENAVTKEITPDLFDFVVSAPSDVLLRAYKSICSCFLGQVVECPKYATPYHYHGLYRDFLEQCNDYLEYARHDANGNKLKFFETSNDTTDASGPDMSITVGHIIDNPTFPFDGDVEITDTDSEGNVTTLWDDQAEGVWENNLQIPADLLLRKVKYIVLNGEKKRLRIEVG